MIEYILQNFNATTFFLALGLAFFLFSLVNFIIAYARMKNTRKEADRAEEELLKLKQKLKGTDKLFDDIISKKDKP